MEGSSCGHGHRGRQGAGSRRVCRLLSTPVTTPLVRASSRRRPLRRAYRLGPVSEGTGRARAALRTRDRTRLRPLPSAQSRPRPGRGGAELELRQGRRRDDWAGPRRVCDARPVPRAPCPLVLAEGSTGAPVGGGGTDRVRGRVWAVRWPRGRSGAPDGRTVCGRTVASGISRCARVGSEGEDRGVVVGVAVTRSRVGCEPRAGTCRCGGLAGRGIWRSPNEARASDGAGTCKATA